MLYWLKNIKSNQCPETIYYTERQLGKAPVFPVTKLLSDNHTFHTPSKKAVYKNHITSWLIFILLNVIPIICDIMYPPSLNGKFSP